MKHVYTTNSSDETEALAAEIAPSLQGKIILLQGNLGAGKTTFVRGVARGLGIKGRVVSPTFAYEKIYGKGKKVVRHFDLYRISDNEDSLLEEELHELFSHTTDTILIEWPERLAIRPQTISGREVLSVTIEHAGEDTRIIDIQNENSEILTTEQIKEFYARYHTPFHVTQHCLTVANFAVKIANLLSRNGYKIDTDLVRQAALLHDIVRYVDFKNFDPDTWKFDYSTEDLHYWIEMRKKHAGRHHAAVGAEILHAHGFPKTAKIVAKHDFLSIETGFESWEEKVLYYADKRAKHDSIVPLHERLEDGRQRNAPHLLNTENSHALDEKVFALEKEIFHAIGMLL